MLIVVNSFGVFLLNIYHIFTMFYPNITANQKHLTKNLTYYNAISIP